MPPRLSRDPSGAYVRADQPMRQPAYRAKKLAAESVPAQIEQQPEPTGDKPRKKRGILVPLVTLGALGAATVLATLAVSSSTAHVAVSAPPAAATTLIPVLLPSVPSTGAAAPTKALASATHYALSASETEQAGRMHAAIESRVAAGTLGVSPDVLYGIVSDFMRDGVDTTINDMAAKLASVADAAATKMAAGVARAIKASPAFVGTIVHHATAAAVSVVKAVAPADAFARAEAAIADITTPKPRECAAQPARPLCPMPADVLGRASRAYIDAEQQLQNATLSGDVVSIASAGAAKHEAALALACAKHRSDTTRVVTNDQVVRMRMHASSLRAKLHDNDNSYRRRNLKAGELIGQQYQAFADRHNVLGRDAEHAERCARRAQLLAESYALDCALERSIFMCTPLSAAFDERDLAWPHEFDALMNPNDHRCFVSHLGRVRQPAEFGRGPAQCIRSIATYGLQNSPMCQTRLIGAMATIVSLSGMYSKEEGLIRPFVCLADAAAKSNTSSTSTSISTFTSANSTSLVVRPVAQQPSLPSTTAGQLTGPPNMTAGQPSSPPNTTAGQPPSPPNMTAGQLSTPPNTTASQPSSPPNTGQLSRLPNTTAAQPSSLPDTTASQASGLMTAAASQRSSLLNTTVLQRSSLLNTSASHSSSPPSTTAGYSSSLPNTTAEQRSSLPNTTAAHLLGLPAAAVSQPVQRSSRAAPDLVAERSAASAPRDGTVSVAPIQGIASASILSNPSFGLGMRLGHAPIASLARDAVVPERTVGRDAPDSRSGGSSSSDYLPHFSCILIVAVAGLSALLPASQRALGEHERERAFTDERVQIDDALALRELREPLALAHQAALASYMTVDQQSRFDSSLRRLDTNGFKLDLFSWDLDSTNDTARLMLARALELFHRRVAVRAISIKDLWSAMLAMNYDTTKVASSTNSCTAAFSVALLSCGLMERSMRNKGFGMRSPSIQTLACDVALKFGRPDAHRSMYHIFAHHSMNRCNDGMQLYAHDAISAAFDKPSAPQLQLQLAAFNTDAVNNSFVQLSEAGRDADLMPELPCTMDDASDALRDALHLVLGVRPTHNAALLFVALTI